MTQNPHESKTVKGDEAIVLIDRMRSQGCYEDARERINATATVIAERIVVAVAGQTWQLSPDPYSQNVKEQGLPCEELTGDIARRPMAHSIQFGRTFSPAEFATANDIVRQEAARYGATDESSLFNEQYKRDVDIRGNGYEFTLGQINVATLNITGGCFLMHSVAELTPGQPPPEPPIVPPPPAPPS